MTDRWQPGAPERAGAIRIPTSSPAAVDDDAVRRAARVARRSHGDTTTPVDPVPA